MKYLFLYCLATHTYGQTTENRVTKRDTAGL